MSGDPSAALAAINAFGLAAQRAALLRGALTSGFLSRCGSWTTAGELAQATGLGTARTRDLCHALAEIGALAREDDRFRVSDEYAPLLDGVEDHSAIVGLRGAAARERLLEDLFVADSTTAYTDLADDERAAIAAGVTVAPETEFARRVVETLSDRVPVRRDILAAGGRHLELGCGIGGSVLTVLRVFPAATAVGVDLAGDLLVRAREAAETVGVADRVTFVESDAATYTDAQPFDSVFWSQYFFPAGTRAATLANAYARLRPGGVLSAPLLRDPNGLATSPQGTIDALLASAWHVPAYTPAQITAEIAEAITSSATTIWARRP
jgi:SAM-dependent methyltransferase